MSKSHIEWLEEQCEPKKKPTEQDIFKEFEEMGYLKQLKDDYEILLIKREEYSVIRINLTKKVYFKWEHCSLSCPIDMKEHQLLHRLFKIWGWFDE